MLHLHLNSYQMTHVTEDQTTYLILSHIRRQFMRHVTDFTFFFFFFFSLPSTDLFFHRYFENKSLPHYCLWTWSASVRVWPSFLLTNSLEANVGYSASARQITHQTRFQRMARDFRGVAALPLRNTAFCQLKKTV